MCHRREGRENGKAGGLGKLMGNAVSWTWCGRCAQEFTSAAISYIKPSQDQPSHNSSMDKEMSNEAVMLAEDLFAGDGCSKKMFFGVTVLTQVDYPLS